MTTALYRGRFAPSPTGPLHFGSLVTAVGSFLQARRQGGVWLVRIEDIDPPREVPGAADDILFTLDAFGLHWDEAVMYQSCRGDAYRNVLEHLAGIGMLFHCSCSRKDLQGFLIYPGICRTRTREGVTPTAIRVRCESPAIEFTDLIQGVVRQDIASEIGDFVLRRADGPFAYQLAVVVDDATQGISEVMRGNDLLTQTGAQIYLQRLLEVSTPRYAHLPIATNAKGEKLSKQTYALPVDKKDPSPALWMALDFLGHPPPLELQGAPAVDILAWGLANWDSAKIPAVASRPSPV